MWLGQYLSSPFVCSGNPELGTATTMWLLDLGENLFSSTIPTELGTLTFLYGLYLNGNYLTGPIPSELGSLPDLQELWLENNDLSGELPETFELLALNITMVYLSNNTLLWGEIAEELCFIEELYFDCSSYLCGCNCSCSGNISDTEWLLSSNFTNSTI